MRPQERKLIDRLILTGTVTVAEATQMQLPTAQHSVVRDLRDNLLILLCAHPMGEAGPSSGLAELEALRRAIDRERQVWIEGLNDQAGRHVLKVSVGVTRENRERSRWDILLPLGSPAGDHWGAAINVYTRVISSRVVDGLLHPVLAAESIGGTNRRAVPGDVELLGVKTIDSAKRLYDRWKDVPASRDETVRSMARIFEACTWPETSDPRMSTDL